MKGNEIKGRGVRKIISNIERGERGKLGEGQRDKEEEGGGEKRRKSEGGGGTKRKMNDDSCGPGPGRVDKTPRRSPGGKRSSPPGPKIKPNHKEAPLNRGAVGDIRKWLAKSYREGRELKDTGQRRGLQQDNTLGPKAPLETQTEAPPGSWRQGDCVRTQERTKVSAPPPLEPSKTPKPDKQGRREAKNSDMNTTRSTTKEGTGMPPKKGLER